MNDADYTGFRETAERRQMVARTIYGLWTCQGRDDSAIAAALLDGRVDALGRYVMFVDDEFGQENSREPTLSHNQTQSPSNLKESIIDRVHCKDLSYDDFFLNYMRPNKPVVIEGLADKWRARKDWVRKNGQPNLERLRVLFGIDIAPVHVQTSGGFTIARPKKEEQTLSDYAYWWKHHHGETSNLNPSSTPLWYLKDWKFVAAHPEYGAYEWPEYFRDDWLNGAMRNAYKFVYLGPKGTSTRLHADVLRSYSWSSNVCGRKRWYLVPPRYTYLLYDCFGERLASDLHSDLHDGTGMFFPGLAEARRHAVEVIQEAGETVFVPSGWHHTVENLEPTLSINHNWLNGTNIKWSWDKLRKEIDALYLSTNEPQRSKDVSGNVPSTPSGPSEVSIHNNKNDNDMSQVGDDLVLLWMVLSKKARNVLLDSDHDSPSISQKDWSMEEFNLRAMLPILEGIEQVIREGKDPGLTKQCDCDVANLIQDIRARLLPP